MIYRGIYRDLWGNFHWDQQSPYQLSGNQPLWLPISKANWKVIVRWTPCKHQHFCVGIILYYMYPVLWTTIYIYIHRETKVYPRTANHIIFILHQRLFAVLIVRTLLCRLKFVRPNSVLKRFMYDVGTRHGTSWHSLHELILSVVKNGEVLRLPKLYSVPIHNLVTCQ